MNKQIYRLIIVAAFVLSATASIVNSALIEEVEIEGNVNVSDNEITNVIAVQPGQEFKSSVLSEDISAIFGMGKFEDVAVFTEEISTASIKVIYEVIEKPIISKVVFKGNENIKSKKIVKELESRQKDFFDESTLKADRKKIEEYYRDKGYVRCTVEAYSNQVNQDEIEITYFIEEGNKITVADIKLIGVAGESYKKVYKLLEIKEGKVLKQDQLQKDLTKIEEYYKNNGYINVQVNDPLVTYGPDDKNVYLTIFITENNKYKIGAVDIAGYENISREDILNNITAKEGEIYSQKAIEKDIAAIQELYGLKGYIQVQIRPEFSFNQEENKVNIQYNISEGPKVFVNNIFINGNYVTKEYVIKRHLQISEGDPFNISKVRNSQRQIFQLGFFRDVQINILPTESPNNTDLVFKVEEQKTGTASIGAGYSTQDKLVGTVQISQDNLFGRGQKLSFMWEFGREKQNYRIDFNEPYLFNTPTPFNVSAYNTIRTRYYQEKEYTENRAGGSLSLGRHFTKDLSGYLKYTLEQVKIENVSPSIQDELSEENDTTSGVTPTLIYDSRDYPFDPSTGMLLRGSNQFAGGIFGGTQDFLKFESKATYFKPVWKRLVGVLNLETGIVAEYGDTEEVPVYERFDVGGAESVRGYESWGDIGAPEGGKYKLVLNAELKFPIFAEKGQTILQGAFFYDVGSSWTDFEDITLQPGTDRNSLRRGVGLGIRFKTRAFPIRLDWGYGIDKDPKEWSWYFTLGDIF